MNKRTLALAMMFAMVMMLTPLMVGGDLDAEDAPDTVEIPEPSVGNAYVSNNDGVVTIWGETRNADPVEELYIELFENDTKMGEVVLNDVEGIYAATTSSLTWHMMVIGEEYDTYWTTTWEDGYPSRDAQPTTVKMYVDGRFVSEAPVEMNRPDGLIPVVWQDLFWKEYTTAELKALFHPAGEPGSGDVVISIPSDIILKEGENWIPIPVNGYQGAGISTIKGNGKTISGLDAPLFAGGFAGTSGIVITDLTIKDSTIVSEHGTGSGAFIEYIENPTLSTTF